jgi:hypothetical protein
MQTCGALMLKLVGRESRTDGTEVDETIKP